MIETRYCFTCGALLLDDRELYGYDTHTGKPMYFVPYKCPNDTKWYRAHPVSTPYVSF